jgi:DMSO/TMAO reductase YedYZ molybdopterin-dependent catalytic subunit
MINRWLIRAGFVALAISTTAAIPVLAQAKVAPGTLELIGMGGAHKTLTAADIAKMPHVEATVSSHNVSGKYSGVLLGELLKLIGRRVGESLRGKALATVISVEAADNYRVVFALAEADSGFTSKVIFLADKKNGAPLDSAEGPLRMIVPDEGRPARWAKRVVRIRLVSVE